MAGRPVPFGALGSPPGRLGTLCRGGWITVGNQRIVSLTYESDYSLVIDKLCDEVVEGETAVARFYQDFAVPNEYSSIYILLQQLVSGLEEIEEALVRSF